MDTLDTLDKMKTMDTLEKMDTLDTMDIQEDIGCIGYHTLVTLHWSHQCIHINMGTTV